MTENLMDCCSNCEECRVPEERCPFNIELTADEYRLSDDLDKEILKEREEKPITMDKYIHNRLDKKAYTRERDRILEHRRYWKNPDLMRERARARYYRNQEHRKSQQREYYAEHRDEVRIKNNEYYWKNREEINAKRRENYRKKKELMKVETG